jgi:hypothetical protein
MSVSSDLEGSQVRNLAKRTEARSLIVSIDDKVSKGEYSSAGSKRRRSEEARCQSRVRRKRLTILCSDYLFWGQMQFDHLSISPRDESRLFVSGT